MRLGLCYLYATDLWLMTAYANAGVYFTLTPHWSVAQESFHLDSPTVQLVNVNSTAEFKVST